MEGKKVRILLVEDDISFGRILKDYLSLNGFEVIHMKDGVDGWNAFRNHHFDLCVLDIMMPKRDGYELASQIRKENKTVPLFFLTSKARKDDMLNGYETGADDFIIKPVDADILMHKTELQINYQGLNAEERANIIQTLINTNGKDVQLMHVKKNTIEKQEPQSTDKNQPGPTGMETIQETNITEVSLFPNPGNGRFHLSFKVEKPANVKLRITDLQGNEVYASVLSNYSGRFEKDIYRSDLAKGTYLLDVIAGTEKKTTKVVMQ